MSEREHHMKEETSPTDIELTEGCNLLPTQVSSFAPKSEICKRNVEVQESPIHLYRFRYDREQDVRVGRRSGNVPREYS